jgi:NodT family efflux transporter outer membrane factor (OMF) lipoprotein
MTMAAPFLTLRPWILGLAGTIPLMGCVGPDFVPPAPPAVERFEAQPQTTMEMDGQHLRPGADLPADWWTLFRSDALDALIVQALAANPDLTAAQAALRAATEATAAQQGAFFPTVDASFSSNRSKTATASVTGSSTQTAPVTNLHTAQLTIAYSPDLWGANARQVEGLEAMADVQRLQWQATRLTLASNVAVGAIGEASLNGQIAATEKIIAIERDLLDILRKQRRFGHVADADVVLQETALASAEQTLPPLLKQREQQHDALAALLGRLPAEQPIPQLDLAALHLPDDLPVSLPALLVRQRPDIRQAEANLHAAAAAVGVAVANRLPLVSLSADMGSVGALLSGRDTGVSPTKAGIFTPGTGFWSLAGSIAQPVFDGFALMHRQRAAEATLEQAAAQYQSTVVAAFQNVADALAAIRWDSQSRQAAARTAAKAEEGLEIARRQLALGDIAYPTLLAAEQSQLQARIALVQADANRLSDTVALFQALGGGWWNGTVSADKLVSGGPVL